MTIGAFEEIDAQEVEDVLLRMRKCLVDVRLATSPIPRGNACQLLKRWGAAIKANSRPTTCG